MVENWDKSLGQFLLNQIWVLIPNIKPVALIKNVGYYKDASRVSNEMAHCAARLAIISIRHKPVIL